MKITQQIALPIQITRVLHFFVILKRNGNAGKECPIGLSAARQGPVNKRKQDL